MVLRTVIEYNHTRQLGKKLWHMRCTAWNCFVVPYFLKLLGYIVHCFKLLCCITYFAAQLHCFKLLCCITDFVVQLQCFKLLCCPAALLELFCYITALLEKLLWAMMHCYFAVLLHCLKLLYYCTVLLCCLKLLGFITALLEITWLYYSIAWHCFVVFLHCLEFCDVHTVLLETAMWYLLPETVLLPHCYVALISWDCFTTTLLETDLLWLILLCVISTPPDIVCCSTYCLILLLFYYHTTWNCFAMWYSLLDTALFYYKGKSISNQPIPLPIDRDTQDIHALFQYMF